MFIGKDRNISISVWLVIALGIPLPFLSELISVGGKSLVEYAYLFILGYYVFSNEKLISKLVDFSVVGVRKKGI